MRLPLRTAALSAAILLAFPAGAQTNDSAPFYVGASLGTTHVSNIYRLAGGSNSDSVISAGLLGGIDTRLGRQHLTFDGSLQDNRYRDTKDLNNKSYSLRSALEWQTIGDLSGTLSATSSRSLADFNAGSGVDPIFVKNTARNEEYSATARLGAFSRYSIEGGWNYRKLDYSAPQYDRFSYHQNSGSLGFFGTPGGNVKLGLSARHTTGQYPRYPTGRIIFNPVTQQIEPETAANDYSRNDIDLTANWSAGGRTGMNARLSRSHIDNSPNIASLRNAHGTTGGIGGTWQPTAKLLLNLQYTRDTGIETKLSTSDLNRVYTTWRFTGTYALTGKISFNANANVNRSHSDNGTNAAANYFEKNQSYGLGMRWAFTRSLSLGCQYDHASRDSSILAYTFSANSYGCTGQALIY